jgi:Filamin/ABP280 repeat
MSRWMPTETVCTIYFDLFIIYLSFLFIAADALWAEAYGPGVEDITSNEPTTFTIQARNSDGETLTHGGDPFDVEVIGPDYSPIRAKVFRFRFGIFESTR